MVYATSEASDQPAHVGSLIRAFACRLNILNVKLRMFKLLAELHLEFLSLKLKETAQACLSLHLSKCHIVGNHMPWLISV